MTNDLQSRLEYPQMGLSAALVGELDLIGDWGLVTTDTNLVINGWNNWLERHGSGFAGAVLGRSLFDVYPDLLTRKLDHYYRQALDGRSVILSQQLHKFILWLPSPMTGNRFDCMQQTGRIVPLREGDRICGTCTVIEDVTERVAYEVELRERVEALREADQRKDEFLAMLAHELRNPLAPISNAVEILGLETHPPPTLKAARDIIRRQVSHLVRLVDDLLDVSRVSRGKIKLQKIPCDLRIVVQHAVETIRPFIDCRKQKLNLVLPSDALRVDADVTRLSQVVSNLLNNAAKYTEEGGEIWLTVEKTSDPESLENEAVIRVRDNGRGLDASTLKNLFQLFYQADQNLDRSEGGLGIGLSLVKNLVEMHGGTVEAESAGRGCGSLFTVRLPYQETPPAAGTDHPKPSVPAPHSLRMLVVDDNVDSAESIAMLLQMEGHTVLTSHDGKRAVEVALRERPEVVLLDIGLPYLDGFQACRAMREGGMADSLIVAMSGYGQEEDRRRSKEAGFDAHLIKPVEFQKLRDILAERSRS